MEIKKIVKIKKIVVEKISWLRALVFFSLLIYCGYLWYVFICVNQLNEDERNVYVSTKERAVEFNKAGFESVLQHIEQRKQNYSDSIENIPDIFRLQ